MTWHLQHVSVADGELRALWYRHLGLVTEAVGNSTGQRKTVTRHETWKHGTHQQTAPYGGSEYEGVCAFLSPSVYYLLHSWQSADLTARVLAAREQLQVAAAAQLENHNSLLLLLAVRCLHRPHIYTLITRPRQK